MALPTMKRAPIGAALLSAALLCACGDDTPARQPEPPHPDAGAACAPGEATLPDGGCQSAGVPPGACGQGFTADGADGCVAVLPEAPCPKGQLAVPGDAACRDVAACADGAWGDIPVDASTQLVDASYAGGGSDGSMAKPWLTVQEGVDAAADGAIVAVAEGSYAGILKIAKPVRVWGRCPSLVELVGPSVGTPALDVRPGAAGAVVRGVGMRGPGAAVFLSGTKDVTLEQIWIHDTGDRAINLQNDLGLSAVTLRDSLVEGARFIGIALFAAEATIEGSVIRGTRPDVDKTAGRGIDLEHDGAPATLVLRGSVIEGNHEVGIFVSGSSLSVEASVVRDTAVQVSDGLGGNGIVIQADVGGRSSATITSSVLERNHEHGLAIIGSDATVTSTVVRATGPDGDQAGRGIGVADDIANGQRGNLTLQTSLLDANTDIGLILGGADVLVESTRVRGTLPRPDGAWGRGVQIQWDMDSGARATATLRASVIEGNSEVGVAIVESDATLEQTAIRGTLARASDGLFGDGVFVVPQSGASGAILRGCSVEASARAGISSFGGAVSLEGTRLECNALDIDGEVLMRMSPSFTDAGGNTCGCAGATRACKLLSSSLMPPEALAP